MTDLTEQWKKGELPEGYYYVKDGRNMIAEYLDGYFYNDGNPMTSFNGGVDEVLAPVPSYEKYSSLVNWKEDLTKLCTAKERIIEKYENIDTWWKAEYTELKEENAQLKERNDSLNNRDINLCRIANGIRDENFALKELLKECKRPVCWYVDIFKNKAELLTKIDEVLNA